MSFAKAEVKQVNGVATMVIDGQPIQGLTATSCAFNDPQVVKDFVASGSEIMMIWIEAGIHCWPGPGRYDWTIAEERLKHFEAHSGDSKWIIRVRLGLLDKWFRETYPAETLNAATAKPDDLSVAIIHSPVWLEHVCQMIRDFTAWLKTTRWSNRIIGFMLNAGSSEEWLPHEAADLWQGRYSPVYHREFRKWLKVAYAGDVAALRAAWRHETVNFENATCPAGFARNGSHIWGPYSLRDPKKDRQAIDYYRYLNGTLADHLIAICRAAKEAAGSPILCGGFHSYNWWESGVYSYIQEYGHGYIQKLNESPWVDYISDILSYDGRFPGGPAGYLGLPHSCNVHNKLHYTEVDLQTISSLPDEWRAAWKNGDASITRVGSSEPLIPDPIWNWNCVKCGRDEEEQLAIFQRDHVHNTITGTPYWWFDIRSHNYQEPFMIEGIKKLADIGRQAVNWDRRTISDVAFVCSEDTPMFQASMNGSLLRFELEANHSLLLDGCTRRWGLGGVPFDTYELHDLRARDFPGDQYKLLIFVNCANITPQAAEGVRRWQKDGRTFCWTYAAGVINEETLCPRLNEELIGMRLGWRNQRQNIHVTVGDNGHPLTRGGAALSFGTEGSVGPVFFADDRRATVFGHLRDGGEPGFALRDHGNWKSVYLSMLNFGPALFRNLTSFAGGHVWNENDDVLYANRSMVCLHSASKGDKSIALPAPAIVTDLWTGETTSAPVTRIRAPALPRFRTKIWRTQYVA